MFKDFTTAVRPALVFTVLFAVLLGLAYPAALTGFGQILFPKQANGSLLRDGERVIGSELIGQGFASPSYFHGRLSAAGQGYDAAASAGSNLGPTSQVLADRVKADTAAIKTSPGAIVPPDLVTTSASGLDPHITPEAAYFQAARVAQARQVNVTELRRLIADHTDGAMLGFIGEPRVNVLELNLALDRKAAARANTKQ
ncbi:K+-transporting ATPase ATPase C chain [Sphingobium fontiphilum]|uniref:Potassium-transporting ATPase KdpC subunit n=1 Tax=Sphingobium fontiphilum TaxID=944425 RepID=A0A7W6DER0_9SPHN|nr:potassium-transporting ATPase subunit KdpC [Sphingobium fontiphilum]MBB3981397.1 K+-transporting ATPase ATPase C chain [Sphingobium fontiphilum]